MDFVVVGFGVGTLGVLLGVVMLGWLAGRSERAAMNASAPAAAAYDRAAAAEYRGAGHVFIYAGGAIILATIGGLAGALDDRTGALLVATTATVAALGILFWGYLYRSRNPMPPRPRRQTMPTAASDALPGPLLNVAGPTLHPDDTAIDPAVPPDATDPASAMVPAMALNAEHDAAADATADEPVTQSATDRTSESQTAPEAAAPNPDEPPLGEAAAAEDVIATPANNHATDDAMNGQAAKVVAAVAPDARAGEPRAPTFGNDEIGLEPRKP